MTKTANTIAFALAAFLPIATFGGANAMARHEYVKADAVAAAQAAPVLALQQVVVVGHRA